MQQKDCYDGWRVGISGECQHNRIIRAQVSTKEHEAAIAPKSYRRITTGTQRLRTDQHKRTELRQMKPIKPILFSLMLAVVTLLTTGAASADDLISASHRALQQLVAQNPAAAKCKSRAAAVLVFPEVVKAGFIFGAQEGQGIFSCTADPTAAAGP
jgi:hypothetical protein